MRENKIAESIRQGSTTLKLVQEQTGAATNCGKCIPTIEAILNDRTKK